MTTRPALTSSRPSVSVAICTYNRADLLEGTLERLFVQTVPDSIQWELIVVDNASTDHTAAVLERARAKFPVRTFLETKRGLSHARNRAATEARGDWVLFTDDDVRVAPTWVQSFAEAVERHADALVAGGPIVPWFPVDPDPALLSAFPELERGFCGIDHGKAEGPLERKREVYGANFAVRRSVFSDMQFDPALGVPHGLGEETDLIERVRQRGGNVLWIPTIPVEHYVDPARMSLDYLRKYRAGQGATFVRRFGLPPHATLFGYPRWLVRQWGLSYLRALGWSLVGRQAKALAETRERCYYQGMLTEARRLNVTAASTASALGNEVSRP